MSDPNQDIPDILSYPDKIFILSTGKKTIYNNIEWSRPFGLDVLVWGLDPNYNVFS